jgi:hypothetical protein
MVLDGDLEIFERHNKLVLESAKVLTDHKLENAAPCLNFLTKLALVAPQGTKIVFSGKMGDMLREYCSCDKTLRYRIYEVSFIHFLAMPNWCQMIKIKNNGAFTIGVGKRWHWLAWKVDEVFRIWMLSSAVTNTSLFSHKPALPFT